MNDVPDYAPRCAGPDLKPRLPRIAFPGGACDCHAHVFGPAAQFPYAAERIYTPPDLPWADYAHMLDTLGIDRAVLVQPSVYGTDNAAMLAALAAAGRGVRAVAVVAEDASDAELEELHRAGVRGLRFNVVDRRGARNVLPVDMLRAVANRIAPLGWHIELLINLDEASAFAELMADIPVPVVAGHMGYPHAGARGWTESAAFADLLGAIERGRCWIKLTGPYRISGVELPYDDVDEVACKLASTAPERMVWGTDWPHVMIKKKMPNDADLSDLLERWVPDIRTRTRILVDNPAELYGFEPGEKIGT